MKQQSVERILVTRSVTLGACFALCRESSGALTPLLMLANNLYSVVQACSESAGVGEQCEVTVLDVTEAKGNV